METLYQILGIMAAGLIGWLLYRVIKGQPQSFSKENLNKSFYSMGILAVGLILFVVLLIVMLRQA